MKAAWIVALFVLRVETAKTQAIDCEDAQGESYACLVMPEEPSPMEFVSPRSRQAAVMVTAQESSGASVDLVEQIEEGYALSDANRAALSARRSTPSGALDQALKLQDKLRLVETFHNTIPGGVFTNGSGSTAIGKPGANP